MNDTKINTTQIIDTPTHMIYFYSIPDQLIFDWWDIDKFDKKKDYKIFLMFIKKQFNVDFKLSKSSKISKGNWVSTFENDIMLVETGKDILLDKYIKTYNTYVSIDEGDLMPAFSIKCRELYKEKYAEIQNLKQELGQTKAEVEDLKEILRVNGISLEKKTKNLKYSLETNILTVGQIQKMDISFDEDIKVFLDNDKIIKFDQLESTRFNILEYQITALSKGEVKLIFISKNHLPLEIEMIVQ
ncbi:hypothetical protein [Spiroplasma culicicola]|uniref:Uncharacterized protein n=1 Tax=Spiroplasma culicicola AES-1 TaxID=1276246 RepID=W6AH36_9MOLU|nr:hypothetical protein [Spiroplasma culicicola]AHI52999.1 hypothetical protein SCULI_v1c06580 [Spiroplasma culicicola AES-1]